MRLVSCPRHGLHPVGRCSECERERGSAHARGYDRAWRRLVERAIAAQPFCRDCGATEDLTGDHVVPQARNRRRGRALTLADVQVLCRSCNTKKGAASAAPELRIVDGEPIEEPRFG